MPDQHSRRSLLLWLCFAWAVCALQLRADAVEFSEAKAAGKRLTICRVDLRKERLQLFLRDEAGQPFKRFARLEAFVKGQGRKLTFAMNAGMYHADFTPVGLFIAEGKELAPLNTSAGEGNFFLKPNGVFLITDRGARVIEASEVRHLKEKVILATQSGPMLVHRGKLHPAFRAGSDSRLFRNGVCAPDPQTVIFVNSEDPLNFHEFASFFRDELRCTEALFLDGTINSLHSTTLGRSDFRMDLGPIIGITD
jgi:uncharacterized protein YigE (DUF2233 family)